MAYFLDNLTNSIYVPLHNDAHISLLLSFLRRDPMKSLTVGEFKARFSAILKEVQAGHPIAITYGKKRATLAVLLSYDQYMQSTQRKLGVLQDKASYHVHDDFKIADEDFLTA
jgi:prevent-host-death family protein